MGNSLQVLSSICGWLYFIAWSLSFYPQALLNISRRTTQGVQPDFWLLNVVGFTCYTASTAAFLYSPTIRDEYANRHPVSPTPTVRFNDLVFGVHSLLLSVVVYSQFWPRLWGWEKVKGANRHANTLTWALIWGSSLGTVIVIFIVLAQGGRYVDAATRWTWIDVIYATSYIKLLLTVFKYVPQAIANYHRRSTIGWSITQQLLDFSGGVLSLIQLVIDSSSRGDWSGLTGNPMKLGLSNISLLFDMVFIVQHYVLYGPVEESRSATQRPRDEREPLLSED